MKKRTIPLILATMLLGAFCSTTSLAAEPDSQKVWLDMTQKELDDAYNQRVYAPNIKQVNKRYTSNSKEARQFIGDPQRFAYGPNKTETLDVFTNAADQETDFSCHNR